MPLRTTSGTVLRVGHSDYLLELGTVIMPQPTRVAILRTWSLEGDFPIDSCISLSWIYSFPDMSIRWETFFTVWIRDTINEKKGTSMVAHLDQELLHNKLLHKTLGSPFLGPGPQPRTHCNGPVILPKLYPIININSCFLCTFFALPPFPEEFLYNAIDFFQVLLWNIYSRDVTGTMQTY